MKEKDKKCGRFQAHERNTALVFHITNATNDDKFILEFAPKGDEQCTDGLVFTPVREGGKVVEISVRNNPLVYVTPADGYYRIQNAGLDDTRAVIELVDKYEVTPYVHR